MATATIKGSDTENKNCSLTFGASLDRGGFLPCCMFGTRFTAMRPGCSYNWPDSEGLAGWVGCFLTTPCMACVVYFDKLQLTYIGSLARW